MQYNLVWYGMVWYGMVWYGMVSYRIILVNLPVQIVPFPLKPSLQKQLKEPLVFLQVAFMWHELKSVTHSSISIKIISNVINANII